MKQTYSFTNFQYASYFSPLKQKVCVEVTFLCNYKTVKRFIFVDKEEGANYTKEAEQIIQKEIKSGKLAKYAMRY